MVNQLRGRADGFSNLMGALAFLSVIFFAAVFLSVVHVNGRFDRFAQEPILTPTPSPTPTPTPTPTSTTLNQFYVSPSGSANGNGSIEQPWDLQTAFSHPTAVKPGDTIWLRGGTYVGKYLSKLTGTASGPITVRQYPGERAILDKAGHDSTTQPALKVKGSYVWFWGFEITNSYPDRSRTSPYTGSVKPWRGSGADVYASNVKFINMVFHDNGHGIWDKEDGTEVYGSLFYYNGNNKLEHALYTGNTNGTKYLTDNFVFAQGGYGVHAHSNSTSSEQKGIHIEGNAIFNNGALTLDDQGVWNVHLGGVTGVSAERIVVKSNYVYSPPGNPTNKSKGMRLGYEDTGNKDLQLVDNYIVGKEPLRVLWWQNVESYRNTIYSQANSTELIMPAGVSTAAYRWDFNTYITGRTRGLTFLKDGSPYSFSGWQQATGLDSNSEVVQNTSLRPSGMKVFIHPNKYEAGRGHIIVYNWDLRASVAVDLNSVLPLGASYEVRDAQNYFGEPVACGTYDGTPIQLPMNMTQVTTPVGTVERAASHTAPEFAVFVLRRIPSLPCQ